MSDRTRFDKLSRRLLEVAAKPVTRWLLVAFYLGYLLYHTTEFRWWQAWPLLPRGDAAIMFDMSQRVVAGCRYLAQLAAGNVTELFPYPPPAVLILAALASVGPQLFMALWLMLMAAGFFVSIKASAAGESGTTRSAWLLLGALALVVADQPINWDLRNFNSNLVYLGIVMLAFAQLTKRPILAGCCVGLSIAFKLYSGLLIAWLLLFRPRAAIAGIAVTFLLWIVWPVATFGLSGTATIYDGWREQLRIVADPGLHSAIDNGTAATHPPIITLRRAVVALTGGGHDAPATKSTLAALLCAWSGLVVWYVIRAFRAGVNRMPSRAALADWVVLLLAPLPFSPWLEPYHAIALLPAAVLLLAVMLDNDAARAHRMLAAAALVGIILLREIVDPFRTRGLSLLGQFSLVVIALAVMRREFGRTPNEKSSSIAGNAAARVTSRGAEPAADR